MTHPAVYVFADVDDMLISTVRESPVCGSEPIAVDNKGVVCAWLTPKQRQFLKMFDGNVNIVPTTARTSKGLAQVSLPLVGYAIVSFGGVIRMPDGSAEPRFHAYIAEQSALVKPVLQKLLAAAQSVCEELGANARIRIASDGDLDLFLSIKHNERNLAQLEVVRKWLATRLPDGWHLHHNGNFLAAMPPYLGKEKAVRWFVDNIAGPDVLTIGMGDSLTDLPFMGLCDIAVMPTNSQSFSTLLAGDR